MCNANKMLLPDSDSSSDRVPDVERIYSTSSTDYLMDELASVWRTFLGLIF